MAADVDTLTEVRRVIVTKHALAQARFRYGLPHLVEADIIRDVEDAVAAGREALKLPRAIDAKGSKRARREGCRYAWTEALDRAYVMKRAKDERQDHSPILVVMTAVQGAR